MRIGRRHPPAIVVVAIATAIGVLPFGPAVHGVAAATGLSFLKPTGSHLAGTTDLAVDAPAGTTAVRFYLDRAQLSELTDLYSRQTHTEPSWSTVTDVGWFPAGVHTLRAEADTPTGRLTATKHVVTAGQGTARGVRSLNGGWQFATAGELPDGALDGTSPPAAAPTYDTRDWPTIVVPDSFGAVKAKWNDDNGLLGIYRRTVDLKRPKPGERTALVFESCFWACGYYVDGSRVGSSTGGYLPVRLDVTDAVHTGTNTIAVMVDNRVSTMGEYARPVQGLYWNWGGLLQQARLERVRPRRR